MLKPRQLGSAGLSVSSLGLGCAPISGLYGEAPADEFVVERALDAGINFFDTADAYGFGHNEIVLGRSLRNRRHQAVVATKFGLARRIDGTGLGLNSQPDYITRACAMSLRRLGIDTIDLYYQHRVDPNVSIEETVGAMSRLVEAGKVRFLGLSEVSPATLRRAHRVHPIAAVQSEYSLWVRDPENEILCACRELGVGLVPFSPLGRGFLSATVRKSPNADKTDFRHDLPRFQDGNFERNLVLVDHLAELARQRGVTASQLALAWLLAQGEDIIPIPGTRRLSHLAENVAATRLSLNPADLAAIAATIPAAAISGDRYTSAHFKLVDRS